MNLPIKTVLWIMFLSCSVLPGRAWTAPAPVNNSAAAGQKNFEFEKAEALYRDGKFQDAIILLNSFLETNPKHTRAKELLTEALVISSMESYLLDKQEESVDDLARAMKVAPDAKTISRLYKKVRQERNLTDGARGPLPGSVDEYETALAKIAESQREILAATRQGFKRLNETATQERKDVLKSLGDRETMLVGHIKDSKKFSIWLVLGGILFSLAAVGGITVLIIHLSTRREKILLQQEERIALAIQDQSNKTLEKLTQTLAYMPSFGQDNTPRIPDMRNETAEKLRKIDIIDAEIITEGSQGLGSNNTQVIQVLLADPNPEVRTRAIQALLKFDPQGAFQHIQKLLADDAPEARVAGARILGGVATPESAQTLQYLIKDEDRDVKRQAFLSLNNLLNESLDFKTKESIRNALESSSKDEGWIA